MDEIQPLKLSGSNTLNNLNKNTNEWMKKKKLKMLQECLTHGHYPKDSSEDIKYDVFRINHDQ